MLEITSPSRYSVRVEPLPTMVRVVKPEFSPPPAGRRTSPFVEPVFTRMPESTWLLYALSPERGLTNT